MIGSQASSRRSACYQILPGPQGRLGYHHSLHGSLVACYGAWVPHWLCVRMFLYGRVLSAERLGYSTVCTGNEQKPRAGLGRKTSTVPCSPHNKHHSASEAPLGFAWDEEVHGQPSPSCRPAARCRCAGASTGFLFQESDTAQPLGVTSVNLSIDGNPGNLPEGPKTLSQVPFIVLRGRPYLHRPISCFPGGSSHSPCQRSIVGLIHFALVISGTVDLADQMSAASTGGVQSSACQPDTSPAGRLGPPEVWPTRHWGPGRPCGPFRCLLVLLRWARPAPLPLPKGTHAHSFYLFHGPPVGSLTRKLNLCKFKVYNMLI